jgi:hypothetical protein
MYDDVPEYNDTSEFWCDRCRTHIGYDPVCFDCEDRFDSLLESSASAE